MTILLKLNLYDHKNNSKINQYVCYIAPYIDNLYGSRYELSAGTNYDRDQSYPDFNNINFLNLLDMDGKPKKGAGNFLTNVLKISQDKNTKKFDKKDLKSISIRLINHSYIPKKIINNVSNFQFASNVAIIEIVKNKKTILADYQVKLAGNPVKFEWYTNNLSWHYNAGLKKDLILPWKTFQEHNPLLAGEFIKKIKINEYQNLTSWGADFLKLAKILDVEKITFKIYDKTEKTILDNDDDLTVGHNFSIATFFDGVFLNHNTILGVR